MAVTSRGNTQTKPANAQNYVEYDEYVDYQLEKTRSIVKRTDILTTVTTLAAAVIAYLFVFVVFDQWVIAGGFSYTARVVLLAIMLALVVGTLTRRVLFPLLRRVHPLYAARVIEGSDPQFQSNLVNFVDVKLSNAESVPVVLKSMQKRAAVELSHIDVEEAVDHRPLLRVAYALLAVVILAAAYILWSPKDPFASVKRALAPTAPIEVATETTIKEVTPDDDSDVPARTVVTIEADVRGKDAEHAQILYTTTDHKYVDQVVEMRRIDPTLPRFRGTLNGENGRGLLQSLTYRIVAGDAHTRDYTVNVIQPPGARLDEVHYVFPAYMQLEEKKTLGGDIDGYEGAVVTVKATANVPVKRATVILTDTEAAGDKGEEKSMQVTEGTKLSASWKLEFKPDGTSYRYCHIQVETEKKERDPDPTLYSYHVRPDQRPEVALLAPAGDLTMPANGVIPLVIQASDPDFQLRSVTLKIEKGGEAVPDQRLFEDRELGQSFRGSYDFRLTPLQLTAGENIFFWIEVKDNKQPTANRANTPRIKVDIGKPVSAAEAQKQLADEKQKQQAELDKARDAANPDDTSKQPPRDGQDEPPPDDSQRPQDRAEQGGDKQADRKPSQNERGDQNPADDGSGDAGDRKRQPVTEEEMLQRLIQNQKKDEAPRDKTDTQQLPTDDEKANEKYDSSKPDGEKSDRGQGGTKKDQTKSKNQSRSDNEGDGKTPEDDPKHNRDGTKNQAGSDKSQTDKDQADKKQQNADNKTGDNKRQPPSADEKDQGGDKGPASDKKDGGPGKKSEGDKPGDSAKGAEDKPKSKAQADDKKNPSGKESGDKSNDAKKSGDGSQKDEDGKNKTGNDGSGKDKDGSDAAGKNDKGDDKGQDKPGKDGAGKDGTGKDKGGQDDANPGDKANGDKGNDAGDDKPGKKAADEDDDVAKKNSEKGDARQQKGGKDDDGKKDMKNDADSPQDKAGSDDKPATDQKKQAQGGAGQKKAADSDPASNSNDPSKDKGSPGKSDKPEGDQQPGDGKGDKSQKKGDGHSKTGDNDNPSGKEEPADDDPNAKKKKATGDETGEGTGSDEADPDATKANNDLKKKDGGQPGAKQPADDSSSNGKKSDQKRQPQEGTKKGAADADKANRAPDGKGPTEKTDELDEPPSERADKKPGGDSEKRPGQPPDVGNKPMKGDGRKDGQKSEQPQDGEKGGSAATDEGKPGANKPGEGDKGTDGNTDPMQEKTGQPGDKQKGPGSTTKPSDDGEGQQKDGPGGQAGDKDSQQGSKKGSPGKKSGDQGQPGEGGDKSGDNKGQPGGKQAGQKSGKGDAASGDPGSKPGDAKGQSNGKSGKPGQPGGGQQQTGNGISAPPADGDPGNGPGPADATKPPPRSSDEPSTAEEEQANLEAARKATNLVLQRLKSQLERGEVDQEMMDELGWKDKKDVEKFVKYLEKGMAKNEDDNSPEAEARRMQFEETLRGMNLGNETQRRTGSVGKERAIEQIGAKNAPVPREYQKVWESYTRSLSKQTEKSDAKAKGQDKAKAVKTK